MRFSLDNFARALSMVASKGGIRVLRSRVQRYIDLNGDAFTSIVATLCDNELERIEKDIHKDLKRLLKRVLS